MNIGFFVRHFSERGTEVAIYDYAKHNEELLHNKSFIFYFSGDTQRKMNFPATRDSFDKFESRFPMFEISDFGDMRALVADLRLDFFYTLTHGMRENHIYRFDDKSIWNNCKTVKHCVFETRFPEGDFCFSISHALNRTSGTQMAVIPHMVDLPELDRGVNLRRELGIPEDATVFGRHGGCDSFNIGFVMDAIREFVQVNASTYFVFMNTAPFFVHPNIIYLEKSLDLDRKVRFIQTCDAMIHARGEGETFGCAVAEFSSKNKPVITCSVGCDLEHIDILGNKAITYATKADVTRIFGNFDRIAAAGADWNAYRQYSAENVMETFRLGRIGYRLVAQYIYCLLYTSPSPRD